MTTTTFKQDLTAVYCHALEPSFNSMDIQTKLLEAARSGKAMILYYLTVDDGKVVEDHMEFLPKVKDMVEKTDLIYLVTLLGNKNPEYSLLKMNISENEMKDMPTLDDLTPGQLAEVPKETRQECEEMKKAFYEFNPEKRTSASHMVFFRFIPEISSGYDSD